MFSPLRHGVCLCIAVFAGLPPARASDQWLKLETKDVTAYSDASSRDVVEFVVGFTAFRRAFHEIVGPHFDPPPATVLLFRRMGDFQKHVPKANRRGYEVNTFDADVDGDELLALAVDGDRENALRLVYQFTTVWDLRRCGFDVPLWVSQGTGEVLEDMRLRDGQILVGGYSDDYAQRWRPGALDWSRFFAVGPGSPEYDGREARGVFHGQAWAAMHCVLFGQGTPRDRFNALAAKVHDVGSAEGLATVLGVRPTELDRAVAHHRNKIGKPLVLPFDVESLRRSLKPQPAPEVEVHAEIANLLFAARKPNDAELELARAEALAPDSAIVKEGRAWSAIYHGDTGEALALYREAIAAGSRSAGAYLLSAEERLSEISSTTDEAGSGGVGAEQSAAEVRKALTLDPGNTKAYQVLARALYLAPEVTPQNVDELKPGLALGGGLVVRYYRALLLERCGQSQACVDELKAVSADPMATDRLRRAAAQSAAKIQLKAAADEVDSLLKAGSFDAAVAAAAKAGKTAPEEYASDFARLLSWTEEQRDWNGVRSAYNAGSWADAQVKANAFLVAHPNSRAAASARRLVEFAERKLKAGSDKPDAVVPASADEAPSTNN